MEGALLDLVRGSAVEQQIAVVNTGNLPLAVTCDARVENSDRDALEGWEVSCTGDLGALAVDADGAVTVTFTPTEDAPRRAPSSWLSCSTPKAPWLIHQR